MRFLHLLWNQSREQSVTKLLGRKFQSLLHRHKWEYLYLYGMLVCWLVRLYFKMPEVLAELDGEEMWEDCLRSSCGHVMKDRDINDLTITWLVFGRVSTSISHVRVGMHLRQCTRIKARAWPDHVIYICHVMPIYGHIWHGLTHSAYFPGRLRTMYALAYNRGALDRLVD